ncbi:MAG TPA: hypothetical protein VEG33_06185 [Streptosporangiaceae bacterium]|nr:hypothetical protein [Streptosporangiaceae bacterium]
MLGHRAGSALAALLLITTPAAAQTLVDRIHQLFTFGDCGEPLCLAGSLAGSAFTQRHGSHFIPAAGSANASVIDFITNATAVYTSFLPLGSTSGGVTFKFVGGLPVKTSESSGPIFGERAPTLGRNRFLIGAYVSGIRFTSVRGLPMDNLSFNFTHQDTPPIGQLGNPSFENDVINVQMSLYIDQVVSSFFLTYGLLDKVDLSVAVPLVHSSVEGGSIGQIVPFGPGTPHFFGGDSLNPIIRASAATSGSATGIGDVAGRLKVNLHDEQKFSLALLGEARFPTGDPDNFTGSGQFSGRILAVYSGRYGGFEPNANVGYVNRRGDLFNDGFLANAGFDQLIGSWATLAVEVLSEWQLGHSKLTLPGPVQYNTPYTRTVEPTQIPNQADNRAAGSVGFKFRSGATTFVTNALVPILRGGVSPDIVWTLGAEFNF